MNHRQPQPRNYLHRSIGAGFTLIELMVGLSISAILLTIGMPSMVNLIRDARLASQSDLMVRLLNSARMEAVRQGLDFRVCPVSAADTATACSTAASSGADWSKGWILFDITNAQVIERVVVGSGLTVSATALVSGTPVTLTDITFGGGGGHSKSGNDTLGFCISGRYPHVVEVSLSGRVSKRVGTAKCA